MVENYIFFFVLGDVDWIWWWIYMGSLFLFYLRLKGRVIKVSILFVSYLLWVSGEIKVVV